MIFFCQFPKSIFDFFLCGIPGDTKYLIIVLHEQYPLSVSLHMQIRFPLFILPPASKASQAQ